MYGKRIKRLVTGVDINRTSPLTFSDSIIKLAGSCNGNKAHFSLPRNHLYRGISVIGATGTGKTFFMKRFVSSLRDNIDDNYSMIIVQAKNDFNEIMHKNDLILEQGINSDKSVKWNIFNDILADGYDMKMIELNSRQFVKFLFGYKEEKTNDPFFSEAAAELLYCVIIAYIKCGMNSFAERKKLTNKGLKDFFLNFNTEDYIRVLDNSGESGIIKRLLGEDEDNKQALGVWGELVATILQTFIDVFAEDGDFSIREFVRNKNNRTLFINYDPNYKDTQVRILGSIINLLLNEVLSQNSTDGTVILLCDEVATIGKTNLVEAVNLGRAKKLMTIIGCQSIEQLNSIYGEHDAKGLLAGMCTRLYFGVNEPTTKEFLQQDFGKGTVEYMVFSPGGTCAERIEDYVISDDDINNLQTGECFIKMRDDGGSAKSFRFKFD